jgi:ATP-dependent exoDNAse (exonuclease V) alpha subunit
MDLSPSQQHALQKLQSSGNVFLTGVAGSGKSFLVSHYLKTLKDPQRTPVLASTGAAALLVGGRTFHSFFGLGILEGGIAATVERAARNQRLCKRLNTTDAVVIDEISMIAGTVLRAAEAVARKARGGTRPWGGLRVIAVGDFAQLPPVSLHRAPELGRDWAFLDEIWAQSEFEAVVLPETLRTTEPDLLHALNGVRLGRLDPRTVRFLNERSRRPPDGFDGTRLFGRRAETERFNLEKLEGLPSPVHSFYTIYTGKEKQLEDLKKNAPIPEVIKLKEGALVMLRQNDVEGRWVNGSVGMITKILPEYLKIELANGREIEVEKTTFTMLDAEGQPVASATNFPVNLAYAMTVHKAQGATLDQMQVDLKGLWEPGQAYVALSRARRSAELYIEGWSPASIRTDPRVTAFHEGIGAR